MAHLTRSPSAPTLTIPVRVLQSRQPAAWLSALICLAAPSLAQSPPAHPRLLFTAAEIPGIAARLNQAGTPAQAAYAQCAISAEFEIGGALPSLSNQFSWTFQRTLRRMTELAFRYQLTGNTAYGDNAKSLLLTAVPLVIPTGTSPYQMGTYAGAIALTYDMVHSRLSTAERTTVCNHLIAWAAAMQTGSAGPGGYGSYSAATDNFSFSWSTGIALSLMAVWGDVAYPNIVPAILANVARLQSGWNDVFSPDGSCDESYGYLNYGDSNSMLAGIAAMKCGLGDHLQGTNVLNAGRWITSSLLGSAFVWMGDSGPTHKGLRLDPILYYAVGRSNDAVALWGLDRLYANTPVSDSSVSHAFSPYLNKALFYPVNLVPQPPVVLSAFFRDNLNQGVPTDNKLMNYSQVGLGGHAILHNSPSPSWPQLGALYMIRDEWMNHAHEDDGHLSLVSGGAHHYVDPGYATSSFAGAQSVDHNIVLAQGAAGFGGGTNNHYAPPWPNARFLGSRQALLLSRTADYVRGDHANMWMMQEAGRTVVLVKDAVHPYLILVDRVNKDGQSQTYEEVFHAAGPLTGAGTVASPMTITASGQTLKATWLSPSGITIAGGGQAALASSGVIYYRHRVIATGTDTTFLSVHGGDPVSSTTALPGIFANTAGASVVWPWATDRILVRKGSGAIGDSQTGSDGRFAWIRTVSGSVTEWMLGEGTSLMHAGQTLFAGNSPAVVSVRAGRIDVATVGTAPATTIFTARVGFPVTEVLVNGVSMTFNQAAGLVTVGQTAPGPVASNDDRAYTFDTGFTWDAGTYGAPIITAAGRFGSASGWSGLRLFNAQILPAQPVALGMTSYLLPGASGTVAGFRVESAQGAADILTVDVRPSQSPGTVDVRLSEGTTTLATANVPLSLQTAEGRFLVFYSPVLGLAQVADHLGVPRATVTLTPRTAGFFVRAIVSPLAQIDDVTLFGSQEDGLTPQGVAFWVRPDGRAGCVLFAPQIVLAHSLLLNNQGAWLDPAATAVWGAATGVAEFLCVPFLAGPTLPVGVWEIGLVTTLPAGLSGPSGATAGLMMTTVFGQPLYGTWTF